MPVMMTKPSTTPVACATCWRSGHWTRCSSAQLARRKETTRLPEGRRSACSAGVPNAALAALTSPLSSPSSPNATGGSSSIGGLSDCAGDYAPRHGELAGFPVACVPPAPAAVFRQRDAIRVVALALVRLIVAALALLAREGASDPYVSAGHEPSKVGNSLLTPGKEKPRHGARSRKCSGSSACAPAPPGAIVIPPSTPSLEEPADEPA